MAGFNQFFDEFETTEATRYGVGIGQKFLPNLHGGVEVSKRDIKTPRIFGTDEGGLKEMCLVFKNAGPVRFMLIAKSCGCALIVFGCTHKKWNVTLANATRNIGETRWPCGAENRSVILRSVIQISTAGYTANEPASAGSYATGSNKTVWPGIVGWPPCSCPTETSQSCQLYVLAV